MPNRIWKFRFPDGQVEHRNFNKLLTPGLEIEIRGRRWIVAQVTEYSVTVMPKHADRDGQPTPVPGEALPPATLMGYSDAFEGAAREE